MVGSLPEHLRQLAVRVAQHEMGHYVVARALGFSTADVSLEIIGPVDGHRGTAAVTLPEKVSSLSELRTYLERRILVLYAGAAAETLSAGASKKSVDNETAINGIRNPVVGAEQDHAKAAELIHVLRNITYPEIDPIDDAVTQAQLNEIDERLWHRAVQLVECYAETIIGLGGNLASRVKQTKEKVILDAAYLESLPGVKAIAVIRP